MRNNTSGNARNICMFTPSADGGHALYSKELLSALARGAEGRHCFELVTSENFDRTYHSDLYDIHTILPALVHRKAFSSKAAWITSRLTHYPRRDFKFVEWLRGQPRIAAVHFQEWTPWVAARVIRQIRAMGKKVFFTVHNIVPHRHPRLLPKQLLHWWLRRGCRACDGLFVHTERLAEELSLFLGRRHPPIHIMPHGVWTVEPQPMPSIEERMASKRLLFFGAIRRNKGLGRLLAALRRLPGYSLTIAGDPLEAEYFQTEVLPEVKRLQAEGFDINLIDRFISNEEVGSLFASHSAIVLPYTKEFVAQSGVLFMALAYGLPVVSSEAGGLRDLFNEFRIGTTFTGEDPGTLVDAIRRLHSAESTRDLAREIHAARGKYSWKQAADVTLDVYDEALEGAETSGGKTGVRRKIRINGRVVDTISAG